MPTRPAVTATEVGRWMLDHLAALHAFYGAHQGVRSARKHIGWYLQGRPGGEAWRRALVRVDDAGAQLALVHEALQDTAAAA